MTSCTTSCEVDECAAPLRVVNCETGEWGPWSDCITGRQKRTRHVIKEASNGGAQCLHTDEERPCDEDCAVGEWSEWGVCRDGKRRRERAITKQPFGHGAQCPPLWEEESCVMDCVVSEWSPWTVCRDGKQRRKRLIQRNPNAGGKECPELDEERTCVDETKPIVCPTPAPPPPLPKPVCPIHGHIVATMPATISVPREEGSTDVRKVANALNEQWGLNVYPPTSTLHGTAPVLPPTTASLNAGLGAGYALLPVSTTNGRPVTVELQPGEMLVEMDAQNQRPKIISSASILQQQQQRVFVGTQNGLLNNGVGVHPSITDLQSAPVGQLFQWDPQRGGLMPTSLRSPGMASGWANVDTSDDEPIPQHEQRQVDYSGSFQLYQRPKFEAANYWELSADGE